MRGGRDLSRSLPVAEAPSGPRSDWRTLGRLLPYLWQYKWRVAAALLFVIGAKVANVSVPLLLKELIDRMTLKPGDPAALLVVPVGLLLAYGALRLMTSAFTELRELVFAKATQGASRQIALQTFEHLHSLSLRFHLERQTGGMTRDIERGVRGIESLVSFSLYSIVPTIIEVAMVLSILAVKFDAGFAWITGAALVCYVVFTVTVTEWRTKFRREANLYDSAAHTKAIDSLLNYETVKYFNNEEFEARRYDESLEQLRRSRLKAQTSLSVLNTGQQLIIAIGLVAMLWRATQGVVDGRLTLGDLVMVNAFMIQLYIPLNFLGVIYREIKQNLTDLDKMFTLMDREREVADAPGAEALRTNGPRFQPARRWRWWGRRARASPPWRDCSIAFTTSVTRPHAPLLRMLRCPPSGLPPTWGGPASAAVASSSPARTSAASRRPACAAPSASCRRTRCCSTTRWPTTSATAGPTRPMPRWSRPRAPRTSTTSS